MTKQVITLVSFVIAACTVTNVYLLKNREAFAHTQIMQLQKKSASEATNKSE